MLNKRNFLLIPIIVSSSFAASNVVKEKIQLITSPDELISKDIIRSETLNDYEFNLKLKNLEEITKQKELELQKIELEKQKLELEKQKLGAAALNNNLHETQISFELQKLKEQMKLFDKYPYTFLGFEPAKIDLIRNIIKGKIEKAKLDNLAVLKQQNYFNITVLKQQYDLLNKLNIEINSYYTNLVNLNFGKLKEILNKMNDTIEKLFNTNILYFKDKYLILSKRFEELKTLTNSLIINYNTENNEKVQEIFKELTNAYYNFQSISFEIKQEVLKKLIELKQSNNIKVNNNTINIKVPEIKHQNFENIATDNDINNIKSINNVLMKIDNNKNNKNNKKKSKVIIKPKNINVPRINMENVNRGIDLNYIKKELAAEINVPVDHLKYLTPKDIYKIQSITHKIELLKKILLKLEVDKKLNNDEVSILEDELKIKEHNKITNNKLYIKYKLLDKIDYLNKEKYTILQKSIERYKEEMRKKAEEAIKLKELEIKKAKIEAERKRRLLELQKEKEREERIRREREERLRRIREAERERKIRIKKELEAKKSYINNIFSKYTMIGIINNSLSLQNNATGEIVYIHPGTILEGIKIINIKDFNQGIIEVNYKGYKTTINLSNLSLGGTSSNTF